MEFLKKIIEMFEMHCITDCHNDCCDTKFEMDFSDGGSDGGRRQSQDSITTETVTVTETETVRRRSFAQNDHK